MTGDPFRPPEPDELPGQPWAPQPGSLRAEVIEVYRRTEEARTALRQTWRGRAILWLADHWPFRRLDDDVEEELLG